jgi:hypothetical protein
LALVEEYIDGIQFTVDGYAFRDIGCKSLAIGEKVMLSNDIQVAMGISYPASLPNRIYNELATMNESVNKKLGYSFGMTHTEYMLRDGHFYLIESANRGGGCMTSEIIVPAVSSIDLVQQYINDCCDADMDISKCRITQCPVTLKFFSLRPGRYKAIENWELITNSPSCLYSRLNIGHGEKISEITNDSNRHGFIIAKGDMRNANMLIDSMEVTYEA